MAELIDAAYRARSSVGPLAMGTIANGTHEPTGDPTADEALTTGKSQPKADRKPVNPRSLFEYETPP